MAHRSILLSTGRLTIEEFGPELAGSVHVTSLDEDNRRFLPDEVFDTPEAAAEMIDTLMGFYKTMDGPLVYPIFLASGAHIGHVEAVPIDEGWEIGYHIGKAYTGRGYATEAVRAFAPAMLKKLSAGALYGICVEENHASARVLEKSGFTLEFQGVGLYQGRQRPLRRYVFRLNP